MSLTLADVDAVASMPDPVARNHAITRAYRDLALDVAELIGPVDVNWLAFGAWASATAGRVIRREGLPVDWGTSRAVADGNRAIIADIGPRFVIWRDEVLAAAGPSELALDRTLCHPLFADVPDLVAAFRGFHEAAQMWAALDAMDESAAAASALDKAHAEVVLRSNIQVAAHEQRLADEFVDAALPLGGLVGLFTTSFVSVVTPDGEAEVNDDVPLPHYLKGQRFPSVLAELHDPELCRLVREFGQDPGLDVSASDAWSWEDYAERMGYIVCFFRSYLREARYFDAPPT